MSDQEQTQAHEAAPQQVPQQAAEDASALSVVDGAAEVEAQGPVAQWVSVGNRTMAARAIEHAARSHVRVVATNGYGGVNGPGLTLYLVARDARRMAKAMDAIRADAAINVLQMGE